jgi:hypothetical protein
MKNELLSWLHNLNRSQKSFSELIIRGCPTVAMMLCSLSFIVQICVRDNGVSHRNMITELTPFAHATIE